MRPAWTEDFIGVPCEHPGFFFDRNRIAVEDSCQITALRRYGFATLEPETGEIGLMMIGVCTNGKHHIYKAEQHWLSDYVEDDIPAADLALTLMHLEAWNESAGNLQNNPNKGSMGSWYCNDHYHKTNKEQATKVFQDHIRYNAHNWHDDHRPYLAWGTSTMSAKNKSAKVTPPFSLNKLPTDAAPLRGRINAKTTILYRDALAYRELKRQVLDFPDIAGGALIEGLMASSAFAGLLRTPTDRPSNAAVSERKGGQWAQ